MKNTQPLTAKEIRNLIRKGRWDKPQQGWPWVMLRPISSSFLRKMPSTFSFSVKESKALSLLEVLEPGQFGTKFCLWMPISGTDIPRYNIYRKGSYKGRSKRSEVFGRKILSLFYWVAVFLLRRQCSGRTFPSAILKRIKMSDVHQLHSLPTCGCLSWPNGRYDETHSSNRITQAVQITSRYASVHGAPIHIGEPSPLELKTSKNLISEIR